MTSHRKLFFCALLCSTSLLSGCNDTAPDPRTQIGAKPELPAPQQYLLPPMHVASVVGWKNGERPSASPPQVPCSSLFEDRLARFRQRTQRPP